MNKIIEYVWLAFALIALIAGIYFYTQVGFDTESTVMFFIICFLAALMYSMRRTRRRLLVRNKQNKI